MTKDAHQSQRQIPSPLRGEGKGEGHRTLARALRANQTDAERRLWNLVRARQINGLKFRRQHPIGPYIVDFCCPEQRLIVELDGGQHAELTRQDEDRSQWLRSQGYQVIRFWNHEMMDAEAAVVEAIIHAVSQHPHPTPLPQRERASVGNLLDDASTPTKKEP